jgi:hypothetical protein
MKNPSFYIETSWVLDCAAHLHTCLFYHKMRIWQENFQRQKYVFGNRAAVGFII